jgi:hypothetical protein
MSAETTGWQAISLTTPEGIVRAPGHVVAQVAALPPDRPVAFVAADLGEPAAHARLLFGGLRPLRRHWLASPAGALLDDERLLRLARASGCETLVLGDSWDPARDLALASAGAEERLARLRARLRRLHHLGILSVVRFSFGRPADDEGIFERAVRFCREARVGMPRFETTPAETGGAGVLASAPLMDRETLTNGVLWARRAAYSHRSIWTRCLAFNRASLGHMLANYADRHRVRAEPRGRYTATMRLVRWVGRPIPVRERAPFVSAVVGAVQKRRERLSDAWLRVKAMRDDRIKALVIRVDGVLDLRAARTLLARVRRAVRRSQERIVIDVAGLEAVSVGVLTRFFAENAQRFADLRERVAVHHLREVLEGLRRNAEGLVPNVDLAEVGLADE